MKVEKKEIDALTAELTLTIEKSDYMPDYDQKIKSYQQKAQLKGFRKGKTPISIVKKMYGSSSMYEVVSKVLGTKINEIIAGDEYQIIGEPLIVDKDNIPEIDHNNPSDYAYKFEIGLEPEFEVKGISDGDVYTKIKVAVPESDVNEHIEHLQKTFGEQTDTEDKIVEDDVVYVSVFELEGKSKKEDGISSDFTFSPDKIEDKVKKDVLKLKKGGTFEFDIFSFEKDMPRNDVFKYLLKVDENTEVGNTFKGEITKVVRLKKAAFDQEVFDKYFGKDEVKNEEEARSKIEDSIAAYYDGQAQKLLSREIMSQLVALNQFDLPEGFIKKWVSQDEKNEITDEKFEQILKESRWQIIKRKLVKKFDIEVKQEELVQFLLIRSNHIAPMLTKQQPKICCTQ